MLLNIVLFRGQDGVDDTGLWETNGTAAGTFELAPISGADASGLSPSNLTAFNGAALFEGEDASGDFGLWTTDGTADGTHELQLPASAGANPSGLAPNDLTPFNGQVLFNGADSSGFGLWVTNGAVAGTQELTGIVGASPKGVNPSAITAFNGQALFNGANTVGNLGLWTTDGTALGTHELTHIVSASTTGLDPTDMVVFNGKVLFNGVDASGLSGLWATTGTAAGTSELVAGAGGASDPNGLNPTDLTVFDGKVLFSALDAGGDIGLWVTDGTATGTHEVTGITGADPAGLDPSDLTVYDGEVLFRGLDQLGRPELWVTNGTTTKELTASGASAQSGLNPSNLVVYNGQVLFSGLDSRGFLGLWTTNGTATGTQELAPISETWSLGLAPSDLATIGTPKLTAGASLNYVAGATAVALDPGLAIGDPGVDQPDWGHSQHRRRVPFRRRAECRLAPSWHHQRLQCDHGSADAFRHGEPGPLSGGT